MHTLKHKRIDFPAWNFHERASRIYERQPGNMKWGTIGVMTHNSQPDMICIPFRLRFLSPRHQLLAQLGSIAFWKVLPELEKNNNKTDSIAATTFRLETIQNKQQRRKIENFGSCGKVWVQSNNKELIMNFRTSGRKYITLTHAHNCDWALGLPPHLHHIYAQCGPPGNKRLLWLLPCSRQPKPPASWKGLSVRDLRPGHRTAHRTDHRLFRLDGN